MRYVGVIVDISLEQLDRTFTYLVPDEYEQKAQIGSLAVIPFGNSTRTGYVVEYIDVPDYDPDKIKPILGIKEDCVAIDAKLIRLAYWMKTNYGGTIIQALKSVLPVKEKVRKEEKKTVHLLIAPEEARAMAVLAGKKHYTAQARLLEALAAAPIADFSLLSNKLNISLTTIKTLENKGILELRSITMFRNAVRGSAQAYKPVILNTAQQQIVDGILQEIQAGDETPVLLKGVTGSGKTEVYMELIAKTVAKGKEAIVLIPEISLTYQMVMRFYNRFGEQVSIIHSRLSKGEKYDRFELAREGKIKVMIGPRSALFTPFQQLGLIIIDEEQEQAYQSETVPKYHARETALALARMFQAKVVLGSATPSLTAYYQAKNGNYHLYLLKERPGSQTMPKVHIVDLREELHKGNRSVFCDQLRELIEDRLKKREQIMLFLNRRGYQGFMNCRDCGHTMECPHCAVSLTAHRNGRLVCHYCGYEKQYIGICPDCGSKHIGTFRAGTEKIEEETRKIFPEARVLRMDMDTTKGKEGHAKILEQFAEGDADILIGTQMIVKGHDFPNVTLMGVLLADTSLHAPDYMAAERTFELLTQAAGRAGRGERPGTVVIQTYDPEHYAVRHAAAQDYDGFYEEEIGYRSLMDYPPVQCMMSVKISSEEESYAKECSELIKEIPMDKSVRIIGPANASIYKINDVYSRMIYYKHPEHDMLIKCKDQIERFIKEQNGQKALKKTQIQFEFR